MPRIIVAHPTNEINVIMSTFKYIIHLQVRYSHFRIR